MTISSSSSSSTTTDDDQPRQPTIKLFIVGLFVASLVITLASLSQEWKDLKNVTGMFGNSSGGNVWWLHDTTRSLEQQHHHQHDSPPLVLPPTFSEFLSFNESSPRRQRFKVGHSQREILLLLTNNNETIISTATNTTNDRRNKNNNDDGNNVVVKFYETKEPYYAAAWLSTMETFLSNPNFQPNPDKPYNPNLEAGTFSGIVRRRNYRTIDMFDFFVHHLSHYKIWFKHLNKTTGDHDDHWSSFLEGLQQMQIDYDQERYNNPSGTRNGNVLVLVPFHGASDRHSQIDEKLLYLNITIKTLAGVFPNIVVSVCDQQNYDYVTRESGLNQYLFDVLYLKNLTRRNHLPHATSVQARHELLSPYGKWRNYYDNNNDDDDDDDDGFQWIYYTEADQIPTLRDVDALLRQTLLDNRTVVVPHRSLPIPILGQDVLGTVHRRSRDKLGAWEDKSTPSSIHLVPDITNQRCCFDFTNLTEIPFADPAVTIFRQRKSHAQLAGSCNQFSKNCHICQLLDNRHNTGPC